MDRTLLRRVKCLGAAMSVVGLLLIEGLGNAAVSANSVRIPDCDGYCGAEVDCAASCIVRDGEIIEEMTCGEYNGGAANNQCNTCDFECSLWSNPSQECWIGGSTSDCETDGPEYAACGDDVCQNGPGGEGCDSCALDCGPCPEIECGDEVCDPGETYVTCPEDCFDPGEQSPCGDGVCSEEAEENWENCFLDCVMPNERCEDDFDCGAEYTCIPGGQPHGGQCILFEFIFTFQNCELNTDCPSGQQCQAVTWEEDPQARPPHPGRCVWFWEVYTR